MAPKENLEAKAISLIDNALSPLDDQLARQRVLGWAMQKFCIKTENNGGNPLQASSAFSGGANPVPAPNLNSIKGFIDGKKPNDKYQRLACLAYFLEKKDGVDGLKAKDLTKANADARQSSISNMPLYLGHATRTYGYFTSMPKGRKALSSRGEAVVDALPNYEKVKQVLKDIPYRTNKKKGKKKKA